MTEWARVGNTYVFYSHRVRSIVYQIGELWMQRVFVIDKEGHEDELDRGEWLDREQAIRNANTAMSRLAFHRRFEKDPPVVLDLDDDEDTGDPDDDEDE